MLATCLVFDALINLLSMDSDVLRRIDVDSNWIAFYTQHSHLDVVANLNVLADSLCEN